LAKLLGERWVKVPSSEWASGTGVFGKIPLKNKVDSNFDIEEERLLEDVRTSLRSILKEDVKRLFQI